MHDQSHDSERLIEAADAGIEQVTDRLDGMPLSQRFFELEQRLTQLRHFRAVLEAEGVEPTRFPEVDG
ncbi:MAG: hypothetical protein ACI9CA_002267 [Natronomonas sp.]|jgi:hypothetical protein